MFKEFFLFELKLKMRQPAIYIFFCFFVFFTYLATSSINVTLGLPTNNVFKNSPYAILSSVLAMCLFGVLAVTVILGGSASRDLDSNFHQIMYANPINKFDFLFGRFCAALLVSFIPFLGVLLGIFIGGLMPWLPDNRVGSISFYPYIYAFLVFIVPYLIFTSSIFYTVTALTRSTVYSFIFALLLLMIYTIVTTVAGFSNTQNNLYIITDPFGITAFEILTRYYTVAEKNTILPLSNELVWSRIMWICIGVSSLVFLWFRFSFTEKRYDNSVKRIQSSDARFIFKPVTQPITLPLIHKKNNLYAEIVKLWNQTKLDFLGIVKSLPFIILTLFTLFNFMPNALTLGEYYGTYTYPVTHRMLELIDGTVYIFLFVIIIYYCGEMVWKERDSNFSEIYDTLPISSYIPFFSKLFSLLLILLFFITINMLIAILTQLLLGYTNIQLSVYFIDMYLIDFSYFAILTILCLFINIIINNKYLGYLITATIIFGNRSLLMVIDFPHHLFELGTAPDYTYSDMNGFSPYAWGLFIFKLYWAFFCIMLIVLSLIFWVRSKSDSIRMRLYLAGLQFNLTLKIIFFAGFIGFFGTGLYIYHQTTTVNIYRTEKQIDKKTAEYEKKYSKYSNFVQPKITEVDLKVDLYPEERRINIKGNYVLSNKSDKNIDTIFIILEEHIELKKLVIANAGMVLDDKYLQIKMYKLEKPLAPKETVNMDFEVAYSVKGFQNEYSSVNSFQLKSTDFVSNGTFFNQLQVCPWIGYQSLFELTGKKRKEFGLKQKEKMPDASNKEALMKHYLSSSADWIDKAHFTVSTSAGQTAIAPGKKVNEWKQNNRHYFEYELNTLSHFFFSFISAKYLVKREKWKNVDLEVYYHPEHAQNVDKMLISMRNSLSYCSENFGPYQFETARIIEFPRYATFAQAFQGTMPYSEGIGFISNLESPDAIDFVYYVVAHEIAHQWWGHQVVSAAVKGATVLSESMAQYSALMIMEKMYGKEKMYKFLKYEMDKYLRRRGAEEDKEQPLLFTEDQPYIHYRKGSVVMYALKEYIGEEKLNSAFKKFVKDKAFQEPPYTNSLEFFEYINEVTPDSLKSMVEDMFKKIILFDNKVTDAKYKLNKDGDYTVYVTVESKKYSADKLGEETEVPVSDWIDIGILDDNQRVLYSTRAHITKSKQEFEIKLKQKPVQAGIDFNLLLIDRRPDDNIKKVDKI